MSDRIKLPIVIREMFEELAGDLRVCLPATITEYDSSTHLASVQPLLRRLFYGADVAVDLPQIHNVPVIHPRTATAIVRLPVTVGDICTLVFADRSLEKWIAGIGLAVDPLDTRQHHLSDAYALLGGYPSGRPLPALHPLALEIAVQPGTKIAIGNGTDELIAVAFAALGQLSSLCQELAAALTQTALITVIDSSTNPTTPPLNAAAFVSAAAQVTSIGAQVDVLQASLGGIKT